LVARPDVPYLQAEGFQYVAMDVYKAITGQHSLPRPDKKRRWPYKPKGRRFNFDSEKVMRRRYPKLVGRFPEMGD
jgi:hypothetical protein